MYAKVIKILKQTGNLTLCKVVKNCHNQRNINCGKITITYT